MAWQCTATSHVELVQNLRSAGLIRTDLVAATFLKVDRGFYTSYSPYTDAPQPIPCGATISAPHMHAETLEIISTSLIDTKEARAGRAPRILDVGCGSGWMTVALAHLTEADKGKIVGMDHIQELVDFSATNARNDTAAATVLPRITFQIGDGRAGTEDGETFDIIHVGATATEFPTALFDQLVDGGHMIVPLQESSGAEYLYDVRRDGAVAVQRKLMGVKFIALTSVESQMQGYREKMGR